MKRFFPILFIAFALTACSSSEKKPDTPEALFAVAQDFEKEERFEIAIQRYQDVKNKFPYSALATQAELAIADVHYKQEAWPEAQVSYQAFRELHPKHPRIDYVIYQIGMSFFQQLPESVDRDLTLAKDAIAAFDEVVTKYPHSENAKDAQEKRRTSLERLAGKEDYIGDFYFRRAQYVSALPRYEGLLQKYPGLGFDARALSRAAISAHKTDQGEKARKYLAVLKSKFPDSPEYDDARKEIE